MKKMNSGRGFSLIELLLVLAIIAILSGIAIPAYLNQRRRARVIGDAQTNAKALMMALEARKAENGVYFTGGPFKWTASGTVPNASVNPAPNFVPKGNSQMDFSVSVGSTAGVTYNLTVTDPKLSNATILTGDQSGTVTVSSAFR